MAIGTGIGAFLGVAVDAIAKRERVGASLNALQRSMHDRIAGRRRDPPIGGQLRSSPIAGSGSDVVKDLPLRAQVGGGGSGRRRGARGQRNCTRAAATRLA